MFAPEGRTFVSASEDGFVRVFSALSGEQIFEKNIDKNVYTARVSSDGSVIACGSHPQRHVTLLDAQTGLLLAKLEGHTDVIDSLCFSPDGCFLASGSRDCTVKLWQVAARRVTQTFEGHTDWIRSLNFSSDGCTLVSGSDDRTMRLWEVATGKQISSFDHSGRVFQAIFSPDGCSVATSGDEPVVRVWSNFEKLALTLEADGQAAAEEIARLRARMAAMEEQYLQLQRMYREEMGEEDTA